MPDTAVKQLVRVPILPYGEWAGHPAGAQSYGPREGAAMLAYYGATAKANGKPLVIDYEHQSLDGVVAPAAGWIWDLFEDLEATPAGIWAMAEWTDRAEAMIRANEYKFISPVVVSGYTDPKTGQTVPWCLFNAALTNTPFMADLMPAVAAKAKARSAFANTIDLSTHQIFTNVGGPAMDLQKIIDKIKGLLGLGEGDDPGKIVDIISKFLEIMKIAESAEDIAPALEEHGAPAPAGDDAAAPMGGLMQPAAMSALIALARKHSEAAKLLKCSTKDVLAAVASLQAQAQGAAKDGFVPRAEHDAVVQELATRKADELVAANAAKIPPANREFWRNRAIRDLEDTRGILDTMPNVLPNAAPAPAADPATAGAQDLDPVALTPAQREWKNKHLNAKK